MNSVTSEAFSRTEILLSKQELRRLTQQHILIAGLGGVGGFTAEALGRLGVQRLTLLDHDVISPSNLNRQLVALHSTLGRFKTEVMAERLRDINPQIDVHIATDFLHKNEAEQWILSQQPDFVADCIDSIASKAALAAACLKHDVPIASSLGAGNRLDVTKVRVTTLNQTHGCALARELRATMRKMGAATSYPVVYSEEQPRKPLPHQAVEGAVSGRPRAVNGTISYMPALFGMMLTGVVVQKLLARHSS